VGWAGGLAFSAGDVEILRPPSEALRMTGLGFGAFRMTGVGVDVRKMTVVGSGYAEHDGCGGWMR
jgi:hypothetical protein